MNLSAPKNVTFYIAVVLWVLGLIAVLSNALASLNFLAFGVNGSAGATLALLGGLVLVLGCVLDGM